MNYELKVKKILEEILNIEAESIESSTPLKNTALSSLTFLKFIVSLEDEFDIQFNDNDLDIEKFNTIDSIIEYIKNLKEK